MTVDPKLMIVCKDCREEFPRRSLLGRPPLRCYECSAKSAGWSHGTAMARYEAKFTTEEWRERGRIKAANRRKADPAAARLRNAQWRHGGRVPPVEPQACPICGRVRKLVVDHDYACCPKKDKSCGHCVRGFICSPCNSAIGFMQNSPEALRMAAQYLEQYAEVLA